MATETIEIFTLKIDIDEVIADTAKLADETANLKERNDALQKSTSATTEQQVKSKAAYDVSNKALRQSQKELQNLTALKGKEIKTIEQGRNALVVANKEWAKQSSLYGDNSKQAQRAAQSTLQLRDRLKELEKGVGDNTRNVGNYAEGFKEALGSNNLFTRSMANLTQALKVAQPVVNVIKNQVSDVKDQMKNAAVGTETMTKAQKASTIATNVMSGALKLFRIALISTGIGALIVALGSLIAFFSKTQRGVDFVSKAMAGLGAGLDVIVDRLAVVGEAFTNLFSGGGIVNFFNDVKEAASGVGDELAREVRLAIELEGALNDLKDKEITLIATQEQRRLKAKELELASKDELKTSAQRAELIKEVQQIQASIFDDEIAIATERARISQAQLNQGESTRDQIEENARVQAQVTQLQTTAVERQITLESEKQSLLKRGREEEKTRATQALNDAKKITDQALKDQKTRLALFIETNESQTEALESGLVFFEDVMNQQLMLEQERHAAGKTNAIEYELALLQIKNDALENQATLTKEFADKEIEAENERKALKKETDVEDLAMKQEAENIEFEAYQETRIAQGEWEFDIIAADLDRQEKAEIAQAEAVGASTTIVEEKFAAIRKQVKKDETNFKLQMASNAFGQVSELLGKETVAGKAAAIAQTTISTYLGAQQAFTSLSVIPIYGTVLGTIAAAAAVAGGLANVRKIVATPKPTIPKASKGMLMGIGGQRHSSGGTKFVGEDGTQFEAESGELIGVMNRRAARSFMNFNNEQGGVQGKSFGNHFADGGIVNRSLQGITPGSASSAGIDYDLLAVKVAEANASLPAPIVFVDDINNGQEGVAEVEAGASV